MRRGLWLVMLGLVLACGDGVFDPSPPPIMIVGLP